jgi:Zn-dependent protease
MKWSWRIARLAGIDIYIHLTFLLVLGYFGWLFYVEGGTLGHALYGVGVILTLFGIVVLHELGHALAAQRYGIRTRDITLLPIGGVARLERMPEDPKQELVVAFAGPLVNVVLAAALFTGLALTRGLAPPLEAMLVRGPFLDQLLWINVGMVVFNLLPAFPMDGGRVLRALLAFKLDYVQATQVAATVGQSMALLFGLLGLLIPNPLLIIIALFVWMGAGAEASMVQMRAAIAGIPIARAMITDFRTLRPQDTLSQATQHILSGSQQDFPVVEDNHVVGVLTRNNLMTGLAQRGFEAPVGEVMQRDFRSAHPHEMLESVLSRLEMNGCHTLPVVRNGQLVGMVTSENLAELLMIQEALRAARGRTK